MASGHILVIGGGIAGSSFARAIAREGSPVTILESTKVFKDRNRGEFVFPWGSVEADRLGLYADLVSVGRELHALQLGIDTEPVDLTKFTQEGLPALGFHHPEMQQKLLSAAADAGASVFRGARVIGLERKPSGVEVCVRINGDDEVLFSEFVVIADGRNSVMRKHAGFKANKGRPGRMIAGVLAGNCGVPEDRMVATRNPRLGCSTTVIPLGGGRARAYFCYETGSREPMSGPADFPRFSRDSYAAHIPESYYKNATVEGPLASFDCTHVWVDHPYCDRVALIGDAAGCTDPTQGQGLSLSLRDARVLRDAMRSAPNWDAAGHAYAVEHDRYFDVISQYIDWVRDLIHTSGPDAESLRARVLPTWSDDPSRNPLLNLRGPDIELTEEVRRRFFGES